MRVLSLFAGIGGLDLGLERTGGFRTIAVAETDPYANRVLAERFPDVPNLGDVTKAEYPDADFICAGFPCQDISFAGAGAGLAGARSGLWREVVRALRVVRPRGALLENVAALLSRGMGTVLGDLAEVGYDAEWHCIPASAVGAPHRRDRVWIVADPCDDGHGDYDRFDENPGAARETRSAGDQRERLRNVSGGSRPPLSGWLAEALANSYGQRKPQPQGALGDVRGRAGDCCEAVADTICIGQSGPREPIHACDQAEAGEGQAGDALNGRLRHQWSAEPDVGRVAHGVPARVDRLRSLGNAVVPQIPELIGRAILEARAA